MDNDTQVGDSPVSDPSAAQSTRSFDRLELANHWLAKTLDDSDFTLQPASADASFRRYWRVYHHGESFILMDAPPEHEDCRPFLQVAEKLHAAGVHVPRIFAHHLDQGFLLLEDFGNRDYLKALKESEAAHPRMTHEAPPEAQALYADALTALLKIQTATDSHGIPAYSHEKLLEEMALFRDWFLLRHLGASLDPEQEQILQTAFEWLAEVAGQQPRVFVHRDYHSRNLMQVRHNNPGVLDFQDAVTGPVTYDLVSLLRDCYIKWPAEQVQRWSQHYRQRWQDATGETVDAAQWQRWFDLMGAQRHLKATGIFCRLNYRDGKPGYLRDIPRTLSYLHELRPAYPALHDLLDLINDFCPRVTRQCGH